MPFPFTLSTQPIPSRKTTSLTHTSTHIHAYTQQPLHIRALSVPRPPEYGSPAESRTQYDELRRTLETTCARARAPFPALRLASEVPPLGESNGGLPCIALPCLRPTDRLCVTRAEAAPSAGGPVCLGLVLVARPPTPAQNTLQSTAASGDPVLHCSIRKCLQAVPEAPACLSSQGGESLTPVILSA